MRFHGLLGYSDSWLYGERPWRPLLGFRLWQQGSRGIPSVPRHETTVTWPAPHWSNQPSPKKTSHLRGKGSHIYPESVLPCSARFIPQDLLAPDLEAPPWFWSLDPWNRRKNTHRGTGMQLQIPKNVCYCFLGCNLWVWTGASRMHSTQNQNGILEPWNLELLLLLTCYCCWVG